MRPLGPGARIAPGVRVVAHLARSNRLDVYDAWCAHRGCRVAVKTLRPDRRGDAGARRALVREGRLLRRLAHPHLVRAYAVEDDPRPAVVLETLGGETLERLAAGPAPLAPEELAGLGAQVASALGYLHAEGVLHLDLKPANVIADAGGRAKVIDLSHHGRPGRRRPGGGTWCFMAPEQVRGGEVGPAADVWGLGLLLHHAWTGRAALADLADELDADDPQLRARVPSIARERPGLPPRLAATIDACLEPAPGDRPGLGALVEACAARQLA